MNNKTKNLGMTFQYEDNGRCETLGERQSVQDRINKPWAIRLESRRQDTHPEINGGKPFTIARYTQNLDTCGRTQAEQSFEVFSTLAKETAEFIILVTSDGKTRTQYGKDYLKQCYDRYVLGYKGSEEVEQLLEETTAVAL